MSFLTSKTIAIEILNKQGTAIITFRKQRTVPSNYNEMGLGRKIWWEFKRLAGVIKWRMT